jgi:hypothetical protein
MCTYTLTFGNRAESHAGMRMIGADTFAGFTYDELKDIPNAEIYYLKQLLPETVRHTVEDAYLIVIRNGLHQFGIDKDALLSELQQQPYDTKAKMRGRVVNKHARHNNVIGDTVIAPNFNDGQGTVISFESVPLINQLRKCIGEVFGPKAVNLFAETNKYHDINKSYIGFHGDTERKIVVAARIGETFPLHYQWYNNHIKVGAPFTIQLNSGDVYAMSEKAVGFDWRKSSGFTLRHAAGNIF